MLKEELKQTIGGLWAALAPTESVAKTTTVAIDAEGVVVSNPYGHGAARWTEPLLIEGAVGVPGVELVKLLNALPDSELVVQVAKGKLTFRGGRFRGVIPIQPLEEMPELPEVAGEAVDDIQVSEEEWASLATAGDFADHAESSAAELTAVYWGPQGIIACNRISAIHYPGAKREVPALIPKSSLVAAAKLGEKPNSIQLGPNCVRWMWDTVEVVVPTVSMEYPLEMLLDLFASAREGGARWECDLAVLREAVNRAAQLHNQLSVTILQNRLVIKAIGTIPSTDTVTGQLFGGEGLLGETFILYVPEIQRTLSISDQVVWVFGEKSGRNILLAQNDGFYCCIALTGER